MGMDLVTCVQCTIFVEKETLLLAGLLNNWYCTSFRQYMDAGDATDTTPNDKPRDCIAGKNECRLKCECTIAHNGKKQFLMTRLSALNAIQVPQLQ